MAKAPSAFPGLDEADWDDIARRIARQARLDMQRLTEGGLRVGNVRRLASLTESLQQLYGLSRDEGWVAARATGDTAQALSRSLRQVLGGIPAEVQRAVDGAVTFSAAANAPIVLNEGAVAAIIDRTQGAVTADWTRLAVRARDGIVDTLRQAVIGGTGARSAAHSMYYGTYGNTKLTHSRALTIARTEVNDAYQTANLTTYAAAGVTHYRWYCTNDGRACAICLSMNGTVLTLDTPPAQHPNCRCEMLPVLPKELPRVTSDGRWPGTRIPNSTIQSRLPKSWPKVPKDPRDMLVTEQVPGWRGVRHLRRPSPKVRG